MLQAFKDQNIVAKEEIVRNDLAGVLFSPFINFFN